MRHQFLLHGKVLLYGDPGVFTVIVEHLPNTLFVRVELALAVQLIVHFLLRDGKPPAFRLFQHCKIAQPPVQRLRITGCRSALHDGHDLLFVVDPALPDLRAFERRNDRIVGPAGRFGICLPHELHLRTAAVGGNINSKPGQKQGRSKDDRNDLLSHHDPSQTARRFPSPVSMINNRRPKCNRFSEFCPHHSKSGCRSKFALSF